MENSRFTCYACGIVYLVYFWMLLIQLGSCSTSSNNPPATNKWTKSNGINLAQKEENFETPRLGLIGSLNGFQNVTVNLNSLVVLGLGVAAAVSLFSFMDNPLTLFKRSVRQSESSYSDTINIYKLLNDAFNTFSDIVSDEEKLLEKPKSCHKKFKKINRNPSEEKLLQHFPKLKENVDQTHEDFEIKPS